MTITVEAVSPRPGERSRQRHASGRRRWSIANIIVGLVVVVGTGFLAYPSTATWLSDLTHASTVSGYAQEVDSADPSSLADLLDEAHAYNDRLPPGPLRDPYTLNAEGAPVDVEDGRDDYLGQLSLGIHSPMARIRIPELGVDLPIYHGTDEATLSRGVGHLYGSSLPVGGAGTHAVLTGHSGIPGASLFTRLDELEVGDMFTIDWRVRC